MMRFKLPNVGFIMTNSNHLVYAGGHTQGFIFTPRSGNIAQPNGNVLGL